jgi:hypothetical protein
LIAAIEAVCNEGYAVVLRRHPLDFLRCGQNVTAVPEPSTGTGAMLLLLLLGFAGIGLMAHYRHESKRPAWMAV